MLKVEKFKGLTFVFLMLVVMAAFMPACDDEGEPVSYNLTLLITHGEINIGGTLHASGTVLPYEEGTTVSLTPVMDETWYISNVTGAVSSGGDSYQVVMDDDKTVTVSSTVDPY